MSAAAAGHSYTELYSPLYVVGVVLVVALSFVLIAMAVRSQIPLVGMVLFTISGCGSSRRSRYCCDGIAIRDT